MTDRRCPRASGIADELTRRHVIGAVGASVAGGGLLVGATRRGKAQTSVESLSAEDASFQREVVAPAVSAEIAYEYAVDAAPSALVIELLIGDTIVAETSLMTGSQSLSGTETLSGRVLDSDRFAQADFAPERGETLTVDVPVTVGVRVLDGESTLARATASDTATVEVVNPLDSEYARIGGVVTFSASD